MANYERGVLIAGVEHPSPFAGDLIALRRANAGYDPESLLSGGEAEQEESKGKESGVEKRRRCEDEGYH